MTLKALQQAAKAWRLKGDTLVFTNGCFDILHPGHLKILLAAAQEGNKLIVGLNSDLSVKRLKGDDRPVLHEQDRAMMLAAQIFVDAVVIFEEDTPLHLITALMPDVILKGGDYQEHEIVGADVIKNHGGRLVIVPLKDGYSTTRLVEKIKNAH
ncbi:MAG TPA: D-glycero-beta-D-manno-heptose 1-phosphate adenylyltransferase [Edaphocola sp.]|nr:D-glycero-beta-D-manno-heptose 1-phosphate adenylyltransferase [Edaphocola sp.]